VLSAIECGFASIGFSGHAYTPFDLRYCMKDTEAYVSGIKALRDKYQSKIQIYLGTEEDAFAPADRNRYDYIIGSCHYLLKNGVYYPIDSSLDYFNTCVSVFNNDVIALAQSYYSSFCEYILKRKPDIIGHFDLITKYEEVDTPRLFSSKKYNEIAENYARYAVRSGAIFEVNTGAIARGLRKTPYPAQNLLYTILKEGGQVTVTSDSHHASTIGFAFDDTYALLKDVGFDSRWVLYNGEFIKIPL
jgi:histidinol-phosphatase (PHP family)